MEDGSFNVPFALWIAALLIGVMIGVGITSIDFSDPPEIYLTPVDFNPFWNPHDLDI